MSVEHDDDFAYDCEEVEVVESGDDSVPEGRLDLASDSVRAHASHLPAC